MDDLTAFQRDVLFVVAGREEPHGLGVKDELDDYYVEEINHGRLYPNLEDLVESGLVDKSEVDGRTNAYELTDEGEQVLTELREWKAERV